MPMKSADTPLNKAAIQFIWADFFTATKKASSGGAPPQYIFIGGSSPHADPNQKNAAASAEIAATESSVATHAFLSISSPQPL